MKGIITMEEEMVGSIMSVMKNVVKGEVELRAETLSTKITKEMKNMIDGLLSLSLVF
jgi:hypothetical protein